MEKHIEQAWAKRVRVQKRKSTGAKKSLSPSSQPNIPIGPSDSTKGLIETRKRLLEGFKNIIPTIVDYYAPPSSPLFDEQVEGEILEFAQKTGKWIPSLPDLEISNTTLRNKAAQPVFPCIDE